MCSSATVHEAIGPIKSESLAQTNADELRRALSFASGCAAFHVGAPVPIHRGELMFGAGLWRLPPVLSERNATYKT
jgi:hypothetical protein